MPSWPPPALPAAIRETRARRAVEEPKRTADIPLRAGLGMPSIRPTRDLLGPDRTGRQQSKPSSGNGTRASFNRRSSRCAIRRSRRPPGFRSGTSSRSGKVASRIHDTSRRSPSSRASRCRKDCWRPQRRRKKSLRHDRFRRAHHTALLLARCCGRICLFPGSFRSDGLPGECRRSIASIKPSVRCM
jgi:hypothetical protein